MALVGAEALAGVGEPHAGGGILGGTEDQIAISVVLQERERPLVSLEQNRSLQRDTIVSPMSAITAGIGWPSQSRSGTSGRDDKREHD